MNPHLKTSIDLEQAARILRNRLEITQPLPGTDPLACANLGGSSSASAYAWFCAQLEDTLLPYSLAPRDAVLNNLAQFFKAYSGSAEDFLPRLYQYAVHVSSDPRSHLNFFR